MTNLQEHLLLALLTERFSYEHPDHGILPSAVVGGDIRTIEGLLRKDEFVHRAMQTNEPIWDLPKTMTRYLPPRLTPLGRAFYELIDLPSVLQKTAWHEPGSWQQLFDCVAEQAELDPQALSRDALCQHRANVPLEGEYLNGFVETLRKLGRQPRFQATKTEREKEAKQRLSKARKLISVLSCKTQSVLGQWTTLEYQFPEILPAVPNFLESNAHLDRFRDGLQDMAHQLPFVGYIWMRHYLPETGFRIRMLLLHTSQEPTQRNGWAKSLETLWAQSTNWRGKSSLDCSSEGPHAIDQTLRVYAAAEKVVRSLSEDSGDFGCFDSFDMRFFRIPPPQPLAAGGFQNSI